MATRRWWLSPPVIGVAAYAAVALLYAMVVVVQLTTGNIAAVVPPSVARRLVVRGLDGTIPLVAAYNILLAVAPLALIALPGFRTLSEDVWGAVRGRLDARAALVLTAASGAVIALYLAVWQDGVLPGHVERVRWFTDQIPDATPVEPAILVRLQYLVSRVVDIRYSLPIVNALFPVLLMWGLTVGFGRASALPVALATLVVVSTHSPLHYASGLDGEIAAASFALLGLLAVARGRVVLGLFLIWLGLLVKATAVFFLVSAAAILAWRWWRGRFDVRTLVAPVPLGLGAFLVFYYVNFILYVIWRGGTYLVQAASQPFFVHPLRRFADDFGDQFLAVTVLALAAFVVARRDRSLLAYLASSLVLLRCLSRLSGDSYTLFFVPLLVVLVAALFGGIAARWPRHGVAACVLLAAVAIAFNAQWFLRHRDGFISRRTLQWDALMRSVGEAVPPGGEVLYRQISPKYDQERLGRRDLRFTHLPEDPAEVRRRLATPAARLYLAVAFEVDGVMAAALNDAGYRPFFVPVGPPAYPILVFLRTTVPDPATAAKKS